MARKKRTAPRRPKSARQRLQARLVAIDAKHEEVRKAVVFELLTQRKEIDNALRAAGHRRGRPRRKRAE